MFEIIENGLCGECQQEVYALSYGQEVVTPKKYPDDWEARHQAQTTKFNELTEQARGRMVVVATFWDEYEGGEVKATLCERHLRIALDALLEEPNAPNDS